MKKLLLSIIALCSIASLSAQKKGEMFVGGRLGLSTTSVIIEGESSTGVGFQIAPEFGYFITDKFKVGASIEYSFDNSIHSFEIMPNIAYYARICNGFYYTPGFELGLAIGASENLTMPGFGLGLHLGSFEFRPTPKFGMSVNLLSFSYAVMSYRERDLNIKMNSHGINFNLGLSPSVGVKYYF
jgi:hypothetical protein